MQRVAIINSRQALRPTGASEWLRATIAAIATLTNKNNYIFLSSLGEITYELTLNSLSRVGATVEVVVTVEQLKKYADDEESLERYLFDEFKLPSEHLRLLTVEVDESKKVNSQHLRDHEILFRADVIVPISIRPGGFWDTEISANSALSAKVDSRFKVPYQSNSTTIKERYDNRQLNPKTALRLDKCLVHWTRTTNHHWPGEKRWEFLDALAEAHNTYPRSALCTLQRILVEKRIRGSARHMPNSTAMVSLTSGSLTESVSLMKYRARYREMTIEPFAIALPLEAAKGLGASQVTYYTPPEMTLLSQKEKLFAHSTGVSDTDWKKEKEWRVLGDVDLTSVWNELLILTENEIQANKIKELFGLEALPVFES